ncbi:MAG: hypothetical protein P8166_14150 [Candidatus Thiodiazotropha sp.]|jgi:hypothetical protein
MDHCYSRRLLSPFHGVQQIISVAGGVAESMDGETWKLYVADESIISHTGLSEVHFGDWDSRNGIQRSKIRGTAPFRLIETIGERLLTALKSQADQVPFPLADRFECWLLHGEHRRPLALLDSALEDKNLSISDCPTWHPGGASSRDFRSEAGDIDDLRRLIRQAAGRRPLAVWMERGPAGGVCKDGKRIPAEAFPPMLLSTDWPSTPAWCLVTDYLDWQAPWLLQLELETALRQRLEKAAWQRPRETARVFRLFPRTCDHRGLTVTRVKARLLRETPTRPPNEPIYPFYNE